MTEYQIRIATTDDAAMLAELGARTFREAFDPFLPPPDLEAYLRAAYNPAKQMDELANPLRKFFIAEREGVAVGYALLLAHGATPAVSAENPVELERLYLLQNAIGGGLGTVLMNTCIEDSRRSGHTSMWLQVWERNERAIAFYRKMGFESVGERTKELGTKTGRDLIMARKI